MMIGDKAILGCKDVSNKYQDLKVDKELIRIIVETLSFCETTIKKEVLDNILLRIKAYKHNK